MSRRPKTKREKQRQRAEKQKELNRKMEFHEQRERAALEERSKEREVWAKKHGFPELIACIGRGSTNYRFGWYCIDEFMHFYKHQSISLISKLPNKDMEVNVFLQSGDNIILESAKMFDGKVHILGTQSSFLRARQPFQCTYDEFFELQIKSLVLIWTDVPLDLKGYGSIL